MPITGILHDIIAWRNPVVTRSLAPETQAMNKTLASAKGTYDEFVSPVNDCGIFGKTLH